MKYREEREPEPKWTDQNWMNLILNGDHLLARPPYNWREVTDLDYPLLAAQPAAQPPAAQPIIAAQPVVQPQPVLAAQPEDGANALPGPQPDAEPDVPLPPSPGSPPPSEDGDSGPPSRASSSASNTSSTATAHRDSESTVTADDSFRSILSEPASPDASPVRPSVSGAQPGNPPSRSSSSGSAGSKRSAERDQLYDVVPPIIPNPFALVGNALSAAGRYTRQTLKDVGVALSDDIVHQYPPTRKSKKK